jgi:hypothetical protein
LLRNSKKQAVTRILSDKIRFQFSDRYKKEITRILYEEIIGNVFEKDRNLLNSKGLYLYVRNLFEKSVSKQDYYLTMEEFESLATLEKDSILLKV